MKFELSEHNCIVVGFYDLSDPHKWMANTFMGESPGEPGYPIIVDGEKYPSSEHYFQAMKYPGTDKFSVEYRRRIREKTEGVGGLPALSQSLPATLKAEGFAPDPAESNANHWKEWNEKRSMDVMRIAVKAKLDQHKDLAAKLLALGEADKDLIIVEAIPEDYRGTPDATWGDGKNGLGKNQLGLIYMEEYLKRKETYSTANAINEAKRRYGVLVNLRKNQYKGMSLYEIEQARRKDAAVVEVPDDEKVESESFFTDKNADLIKKFLITNRFQVDESAHVEDAGKPILVKDASGTEKFKIHEFKLTTDNKEQATFVAMLNVFKEIHGDKLPKINCEKSLEKTWQAACDQVFGPGKKVNINDSLPAPEPEPLVRRRGR